MKSFDLYGGELVFGRRRLHMFMDTFIIVFALAVVFGVIFVSRNRGNRSSDSSGGDGGFWSFGDSDSDSHSHHDGGGHDGGDCGGGDDGGGH